MPVTLSINKQPGLQSMQFISGIKTLEIGKSCFDIDMKVRKELGKLRKYFIHSLGHGVGKKIHEKPSLSYRSDEVLKKGDVVTVEPGIYFKGKYGIRIEDCIFLGNKKEVLTKSSKKLIEIK